MDEQALRDGLEELARAVDGLTFGLAEEDGRVRGRAAARRLAADVRGHLARLAAWDAPLLVVLGGGSGAGKSTVTNSLVARAVTATGVTRPTTNEPTLVANPADLGWFTDERILPTLPRVTSRADETGRVGAGGAGVLHVIAEPAVPAGLALVDAPDIDSVARDNRELADALLDAADVWLWFVTGRTYADAVGMEYVQRAARRDTATAVALTRVTAEESGPIGADLAAKLDDAGLGCARVLLVPQAVTTDGQLPPDAVADLRGWLWPLAEPANRTALRRQTLDGALEQLAAEVGPLREEVRAQRVAADELAQTASRVFAGVPDGVADALEDGIALRHEVLEQWDRLLGGRRVRAMVESATGALRTWARDAFAGAADAEEERVQRQVRAAVADTVAGHVVEELEEATARTVRAWRTLPGGSAILEAQGDLRVVSPETPARVEAEVAAWQGEITELIRTKGAARRVRARWATTAVNVAATSAILVAFAATGGLTGAEVGIAAGASAAQQALLGRLLGSENVRWLVREIRARLSTRVAALAAAEAERYTQAVTTLAPSADQDAALGEALDKVRDSR